MSNILSRTKSASRVAYSSAGTALTSCGSLHSRQPCAVAEPQPDGLPNAWINKYVKRVVRARNKASTPREEDLVTLMPAVHSKSDKNSNRDNLDAVANVRVEDDYDDEEDSDYPSDLERGQSRSASSSQAAAGGNNRVYAVTERPKTLFRRMSTSASAFSAWALDYDPKAAQQL
ncbi:hypothetical protein PHYPSEUDO_010802 [Phytophthora pseudosyringae]|uniref:Uncharacterized protein n=1 Tax=Phytophthora pseudosyringae TaxID=221518 RepID=A0A8T1WAG9_9STRA|nr:hypothetical protein PHYPSEUDO_010802 [Phytophthora pseudosyringae]